MKNITRTLLQVRNRFAVLKTANISLFAITYFKKCKITVLFRKFKLNSVLRHRCKRIIKSILYPKLFPGYILWLLEIKTPIIDLKNFTMLQSHLQNIHLKIN